MRWLLVLFMLAVFNRAWGAEPTLDEPFAYVELGGGSDPDSVWAAAGAEGYATDFCSFYAGWFAAGVEDISDKSADAFSGLMLGMRLCVPYRISPYVGGGVSAGWGRYYKSATTDGRDNDNDGLVDESGEEKKAYESITSAFPEAGIHFWLNENQRLTFNYRYHYTSEGGDKDYWTANLGFLMSY